MNVVGCLIHVDPSRAGEMDRKISAYPGTDVHHTEADGRLIVTVADTDEATAAQTMMDLQMLDGVLSLALVYHQFDDGEDLAA